MTDIDFDRLLREIDDEVRARRAAGDFPPGLERDLDLLFARFAPATATSDDMGALIEAADRASLIDVDPPTESRTPGISLVKRGERKALGWFFRYLAQQVSAFAGILVQALRVLTRRVEALEDVTPRAVLVPTAADLGDAPPAVAAALAGVRGRILVAEAGDGALLHALTEFDAYGVEPRAPLADAAALAGLDVRADDVFDHLRAVERGALGAVVLAGAVDRESLGAKIRLLDLALDALADDGRVVVAGRDPATWGAANAVEADLSPGRPLQPDSWAHLLRERGLQVSTGTGFVVTARR